MKNPDPSKNSLPFKISCLVFLTNKNGEHLLIKRNKEPNQKCWSPIGGKLNMHLGESPLECARRETLEEINLDLKDDNLSCFGYISEKCYEGKTHWLMFLFKSKVYLENLPNPISEGHFSFFTRKEINDLNIPETDRSLLWPYYDTHSDGFIGLRANCNPNNQLEIFKEISLL